MKQLTIIHLPSPPLAQSLRWQGMADRLTIFLFFLVIFALPIVGLFIKTPEIPAYENRKRADFPHIHLKKNDLKLLPDQLEIYLNDRIGFRDKLMQMQIWLDRDLFQGSSSNKVAIGPQGWLFLKEQTPFDQPHPLPELFEKQVQDWCDEIARRQNWLENRGRHYVLLIAPDKHTIYPEELPKCYQYWVKNSLLDALIQKAKSRHLHVVDLRENLLAIKNEKQVYCKFDTHWNDEATWLASHSLLQQFQQWYPQIDNPSRSEFYMKIEPFAQFDLYRQLGYSEVASEPYITIHKKQSSGFVRESIELPAKDLSRFLTYLPASRSKSQNIAKPAKPRVLFLHTSFGARILPIWQESLPELINIPTIWFPKELIEQYSPDIVCEEIVERMLKLPVPH